MSMRVGTILAVVAVAALGGANMARAERTGTGNVFSDAVFWFSGGAIDDNANTCFDQGEMRDVRHIGIGEKTHTLNRSYRHGASVNYSIVITNMPPRNCATGRNG